MAMVVLTITVVDADGETQPVSIYVNDVGTTTITTLLNDLNTYWNMLAPLVDGQIDGANARIVADPSTFSQNPLVATSDIQEQVLLRLGTANPNWSSFLTIPTVQEVILVNSGEGKIVDITDPNVSSFYTWLIDPVASGGIGATDSHGVDITQIRSGVQRFAGK